MKQLAGRAAAAAAPASGTSARVAVVLGALVRAGRPGTGPRELEGSLGISRGAAHRILQVMSDFRIARVGASGRYEPGARLLAWAGFLAEHHPVLRLGNEVLAGLAEETQETALLVSYSWPDPHGVTIATCESTRPVRYKVAAGSPTPLHVGSAGHAILAQLPMGWGGGSQQPVCTEMAGTEPADLEDQLAETRRLGFAVTVGERIPEAAGAASAFSRDGSVAGAVNLTVPRYRTDRAQLHAHGAQVRTAARQLTERLQAVDARAVATPRPDVVAREIFASSDLYQAWIAAGDGVGQPVDGRAVARAIAVLDTLARCPVGGTTAEELAAALGTSAPTMHRSLEDFARYRLARRLRTGRWEAGPQLLVLPAIVGHAPSLAELSRDILTELVVAGGETVCLVRYDEAAGEALFEAVHESPHPFRHAPPAGSRAPLHAGAAGRAILAYLDPPAVLAQELVRFTEATPIDPDSLNRELVGTRGRGYAVSMGEHIPGAVGVAAPFFGDGEVIGSVDITIPSYRSSEALLSALGMRAVAAAQELTRLLSRTGATAA